MISNGIDIGVTDSDIKYREVKNMLLTIGIKPLEQALLYMSPIM